ncbi:MAG TPA: hypothetical protein VH370_11645 [Humisphaera sp.]|jgi:MFS family permease|nr:hypothetical protein [Humisphaera sp.]
MNRPRTFRLLRSAAVVGLIVACGLIAAHHIADYREWTLRFIQVLMLCALLGVVIGAGFVVARQIFTAPMPRRTRGLLIAFGIFAMAWPILVVCFRGAASLPDRLGGAIVLFVVLLILGFAGWAIYFVVMHVIETPARMREAREYRRRLQKLCVSCGYSLRGNESGICPECGASIKNAS